LGEATHESKDRSIADGKINLEAGSGRVPAATMTHLEQGRLGPGVDAQFGEDAVQIVSGCLGREPEGRGRFLVGLTLCHLGQQPALLRNGIGRPGGAWT